MRRQKLSADPTAMIFGGVSFGIIILGFCCGFLFPVALLLGLIGFFSATKSLKEFEANPQNYDLKSKSNVESGKVLSIFAIAISFLALVIALGVFIFSVETAESFREGFKKGVIYDQQNDSIAGENAKIEEINLNENDTTYYDSDSLSVTK